VHLQVTERSVRRKANEFEELKKFAEFKDRSQEPESRSKEALGMRCAEVRSAFLGVIGNH
jgi:hypothetical protein